MKNFITNLDSIQIYAYIRAKFNGVSDPKNGNTIVLGLAAKDDEGKYRCLSINPEDEDISINSPECKLAAVYWGGALEPTDTRRVFVKSKQDLLNVMNSIKPADPAIILRKLAEDSTRIYWVLVKEKGLISVDKTTYNSSRYDVPMPNDGECVDDCDEYCRYAAKAYWAVEDAIDTIWQIKANLVERVKRFCIAAKAADDAEIAEGAKRIDQLLKFQSQFKSVEEKIADKWNSMSTEDKAKALKIKKTAPKKSVKKTAKKK